MSVDAETVLAVLSADDMSDENFIRHMNKRHADSIGGLHSLWLIHSDVTESWRSFHDRIHKAGYHAHTHKNEA